MSALDPPSAKTPARPTRRRNRGTDERRQLMIDRCKERLVRLPEVRDRTGLSTATIYRKMGEGVFPAKVHLSANVVAWYESDVDAWVADPMGWRAAA